MFFIAYLFFFFQQSFYISPPPPPPPLLFFPFFQPIRMTVRVPSINTFSSYFYLLEALIWVCFFLLLFSPLPPLPVFMIVCLPVYLSLSLSFSQSVVTFIFKATMTTTTTMTIIQQQREQNEWKETQKKTMIMSIRLKTMIIGFKKCDSTLQKLSGYSPNSDSVRFSPDN